MADMTQAEWQAFTQLNQRLRLVTTPQPLFLAHYTSVGVVEQILKNNEIWLSNPLYMNDLEEMRLGIRLAVELFPRVAHAAGGNESRGEKLIDAFNRHVAQLEQEKAIDTYIFCLCRYEHSKPDGLLSMWREYGARGEGAALVFDVQKVPFGPQSPLLIAEVVYATPAERLDQLKGHFEAWAAATKSLNIDDGRIYLAAYAAFLFAKLIALTTKHHGFSEEQEFRVIYIPELDPHGDLKPLLHYHIGLRGLEPKLKYKFGTVRRDTVGTEPALEQSIIADLLEFVLLGPTISSPLARASFIRMFERNGLGQFKDRVNSSSIPLRPSFHVP